MAGNASNRCSKFENPFESLDSSFISSFPLSAFPDPPSCSSSPSLFPNVARRGSLTLNCVGGDGSGAEEIVPSSRSSNRLARDQVLLLERQFSECPKPSAAVRRALADATGLPMLRIGSWFNNRRQRAKVQRRQELHTMHDHSSDTTIRTNDAPPQDENIPISLPTWRQTQTNESKPRTPSSIYESSSACSSPSGAYYASLARALRCAAAAVVQADPSGRLSGYRRESSYPPSYQFPRQENCHQFQSPNAAIEISLQPTSAFSDWGSSRSSLALYTPTPAGQLEDPFEYDRVTSNERPSSELAARCKRDSPVPCSLEEDFAQFQAAVEMNAQSKVFPINLAPTSGLIKRRQMTAFKLDIPPPPLPRRDSCPKEFIDAFDSFTASSEDSQTYKGTSAPVGKSFPFFLNSADATTASSSQPLGLSLDEPVSPATSIPMIGTENPSYIKPALGQIAKESIPFLIDTVPPTLSNSQIASFDTAKQSFRVPELDYSSPTTTPDSANFSNEEMPGKIATIQQEQFFIPLDHTDHDNKILPFYGLHSGDSSASSGLDRRDSSSFPFVEFLNPGFVDLTEMKAKRSGNTIEHLFEQDFSQSC